MDSRLAVILVTYNGWALTRDCLTRLLPQCKPGDRVVVVDNASTDGSPQRIHSEFSEVDLIELPANVGFGRANNRGAAFAQDCDLLVFLNNDTLPEPGLLDTLRTRLGEVEKHQGSAVLSPQTRNRDGSIQINHYTDILLTTFLCNAFRSEAGAARYLHGETQAVQGILGLHACDWTSAICWCMSRKTWERVGGFDSQIFMYYEDVDFAWRAREMHIHFFVDHSVALVHLGGGSAESSLSRSLQHDRAQAYVFGKRWGRKGRAASWLFRFMRSSLRMLILAPFAALHKRFRPGFRVHLGLFKNLF